MSERDDADETHIEAEIDDALEQSESGAPATGSAVRDRFSGSEIFQRIVASAQAEFEDTHAELVFSGVAAGFAITVTVLAYTVVSAAAEGSGSLSHLVKPLLYPVGFVIIVIGHYQLYTENTLPPVTLVLTRLSSVPALARVWGVVLLGNIVGVVIGAYVLAHTAVFSPTEAAVAERFAAEALRVDWWDLFFKGVFAGWLVAGLVWVDHAARDTVARVILTYLLLLVIPVADLYHVITSIGESLFLFFRGGASLGPLVGQYLLPVLLGNTVGGVVPVAILNFAHTHEHVAQDDTDAQERLSIREWVFGGLVGRSHVPFEEE